MYFLDVELSERDIIQILNSICFFINSLTWNDCNMHNKRQISMYFNFDPGEYASQLDDLIRLRDLMSLKANRVIYNCKNDNYFIGQRQYLISKNFNFLYDKRKMDKSLKLYIKNVNKKNKNINLDNKKCEISFLKKYIYK